MNSKKSRSQVARESMESIGRTDKPLGPRTVKWLAEIDASLKRLKKLEPGSEPFNKIVDRLMQLNRTCRHSRQREILRTISTMFDPALPKAAVELELLLEEKDRDVSISTEWTRWADGWVPSGYIAIHPNQVSLRNDTTAENLSEQVVDVLRREAQALLEMAAKVEKKYRMAGKPRKAAA